MKKIIGLIAILAATTLLFFTQKTNELMTIVYLLILYLGNAFLTSKRKDNDLIPLLTITELFYILEFYLLVNNKSGTIVFAALAVLFSFLTIICVIKEKRQNLPKVVIKDETKKRALTKKISLGFLLVALAFNVVLLAFVDYNNANCIYELITLLLNLLMTIIIIYQGYIARESKNNKDMKADMLVVSTIAGNTNTFNVDSRHDKKHLARFISNRPYFMLSIFSLLFIPRIFATADMTVRILYICFLVYIYIVMYYPLTKSEYYGFRKNDPAYRISFKEHFLKSFVYNFVFIVCGLTLSLSLYYVCNDSNNKNALAIGKHDESIVYTDAELEKISVDIRKDFQNDSYIGYEINNNEYSLANGEKYKKLYVYAYEENGLDIYVYEYHKYTTDSELHKIGDIELIDKEISKDYTTDDLDGLDVDFE